MIIKVSKENIIDSAKVYMESWKDSHKDICSSEFIEKHDSEYMVNYLLNKIQNGYKLYIDYFERKPVGIVGINPADEEICLLYILPEEQGKGFGSELLEFALKKCKNPYITVLDSNKKAIDFYLKRGFIPSENQPESNKEKHIFERKYVYQNKNM
ncbi:MAG: GNAT family N-acetyltransferase [Oscillospiraceae bacterium]|nr:GNAT family N-acetyltransferase [Oscillospiraceae bacterium]